MIEIFEEKHGNLVSRVSHLTAPWGERGESSPGGGKMRDPGNEVESTVVINILNFDCSEGPNTVWKTVKIAFLRI